VIGELTAGTDTPPRAPVNIFQIISAWLPLTSDWIDYKDIRSENPPTWKLVSEAEPEVLVAADDKEVVVGDGANAIMEDVASTEGISVGEFVLRDKIVELENFSWDDWEGLEALELVPDLSTIFSFVDFKDIT